MKYWLLSTDWYEKCINSLWVCSNRSSRSLRRAFYTKNQRSSRNEIFLIKYLCTCFEELSIKFETRDSFKDDIIDWQPLGMLRSVISIMKIYTKQHDGCEICLVNKSFEQRIR
jgi:hypothetical protein